MFESAELGNAIDKATYQEEEPKLREALINAQFDLKQSAKFSVLIIVAGPEGAGRSEVVNVLKEWMDPRHLAIKAFDAPTEEELSRPPSWRYWRALPAKGQIGIFFNAWYSEAFAGRILGDESDADFEQRLDNILRIENMLANEGTLILKFWMHLSKKDFKRRSKELAKHPATRWKVTGEDHETFKKYEKLKKLAEFALHKTSTAHSPWIVVEGVDECYRNLTVSRVLLNSLQDRLTHAKHVKPDVSSVSPLVDAPQPTNVIAALDLTKSLDQDEYRRALPRWQGKLNMLLCDPQFQRKGVVVVFEGTDAAGKGSAIRRVTQALDARAYDIHPVAAPNDEERAKPYLWRFWRNVPRLGRLAIFDRSWYGRVLVERVEGYCSVDDWMRAYGEIGDFEDELTANGLIVVKFWLTIDKDEQYRRFKAREQTPFKRFKITEDDWRNREKWDQYINAVCDMIDRTSTENAPWTLVEANDKRYARVKVLKTLVKRIEAGI